MSYTEGEITAALSKKFRQPEFAFLSQVRNQTGFGRRVRTCDALAMSCYPSRGIYLYGFEIKVNRGDWIREQKDPEKAEEIGKNCHFWNVVSPIGIVLRPELPAKWGFYTYDGKDIRQAKPPVLIGDHKTLPIEFVAAMMRKASESSVPRAAVQAMIDEESEKLYRLRISAEKSSDNFELESLRKLRDSIKEFEKASGVHIDQWHGGNIGAAVNKVLHIGTDRDRYGLSCMREALSRLERLSEDTRRHLKDLESLYNPGEISDEE